jgi:FlaA1/EpsC-like NDP-sugar epimerase
MVKKFVMISTDKAVNPSEAAQKRTKTPDNCHGG